MPNTPWPDIRDIRCQDGRHCYTEATPHSSCERCCRCFETARKPEQAAQGELFS